MALKFSIRKETVLLSIISLILLTAALTATVAIANSIVAQTEEVMELVPRPKVAKIVGDIGLTLIRRVEEVAGPDHVVISRISKAVVVFGNASFLTAVRFTNVSLFRSITGFRVDGRLPSKSGEVLVGNILSRLLNLTSGDVFDLIVDRSKFRVEVVGVVTGGGQTGLEVMSPEMGRSGGELEIDVALMGRGAEILDLAREFGGVKVLLGLNAKDFVEGVSQQIENFVLLWISAVFAVVVAASYVTATRTSLEFEGETSTLKALGASRLKVVRLLLVLAAITSMMGSLVGLSVGIVVAQMGVRIMDLLSPIGGLMPFISLSQAAQIFLIAFFASMLGWIPQLNRYANRGT